MGFCNFFEHHLIHSQKSKEGASDVAQLPSNQGLVKEVSPPIPSLECQFSIEEVEKKKVSSRHSLVAERSELECMRPLV